MLSIVAFLYLGNYNHGQKSWDKFTFAALFQTRQTNSHAQIHLHLVSPSPTAPHLQCWTRAHVISPEFQHCIGGGGGWGTTQFKTDNSAFLKLRVENTEN